MSVNATPIGCSNAPPFILQKYDIKWICKFADMRYNRYIEFNKSEFVRNRNFEVY